MTPRFGRRVLALVGGAAASVIVSSAVAAHPLGNATVSRAVLAEVAADRIAVTSVVDMAEIPAFSTIQAIDVDGDGAAGPLESAGWAAARCAEIGSDLRIAWDEIPVALGPAAEPTLAFPPGVGGLETLRLECRFDAAVDASDGRSHAIAVVDTADDGRPGWREVVIVGARGIVISDADVPAASPSGLLTSYPADSLEAPPDVRSGSALVRAGAAAPTPEDQAARVLGGPSVTDPLVSLLVPAGGGALGAALALVLSIGLGVAHGLSPGHGKALVAASLIGARGTARQAMWLAVTVGISHTAGVLLLGAIVLAAGTLLAPDIVLAWLSLVAGACVVLVGATILLRGLAGRRKGAHAHGHDYPHDHDHPHDHGMGPGLEPRGIVVLGLFGGLVPSSSALLVLLLAVTTGQVLLGLGLIVGFGVGMAVALGAVALGSIAIGRRLGQGSASIHPTLARAVAAVPALSGMAVLVAGVAMTIGALDRVL